MKITVVNSEAYLSVYTPSFGLVGMGSCSWRCAQVGRENGRTVTKIFAWGLIENSGNCSGNLHPLNCLRFYVWEEKD